MDRESYLAYQKQYNATRRPNKKEYDRQYWANPENKARILTRQRQKLYGLTPKQEAILFSKPCAICGGKATHVDHDHEINVIRGALCGPCNMALGLLKEDTVRLRAAITYLEEYATRQFSSVS